MYVFLVISTSEGLVSDVKIVKELPLEEGVIRAFKTGMRLSEALESNETLCMVKVEGDHE